MGGGHLIPFAPLVYKWGGGQLSPLPPTPAPPPMHQTRVYFTAAQQYQIILLGEGGGANVRGQVVQGVTLKWNSPAPDSESSTGTMTLPSHTTPKSTTSSVRYNAQLATQ